MTSSISVINLQYEDTGIEGYIQIYTQFNNNYYVKYFENLTEYDRYMTISLDDYKITENHLNISQFLKNKVLCYIMKNSKHIYTYYYHGLSMDCSDTLELFENMQALTSENINACRTEL